MVFEILHEAAINNELLLVDGGLCHWHFNKRAQRIVIYEIISIRRGAGSLMLSQLIQIADKHKAHQILAKCPADLISNEWYEKKGFKKIETVSVGKRGRFANVWVFSIKEGLFI